jgi:hypothetical protein
MKVGRTFMDAGMTLMGASCIYLFKILNALTYDPAILLLGIYTTDIPYITYSHLKVWGHFIYSYILYNTLVERSRIMLVG